jgi:hypothetical protein
LVEAVSDNLALILKSMWHFALQRAAHKGNWWWERLLCCELHLAVQSRTRETKATWRRAPSETPCFLPRQESHLRFCRFVMSFCCLHVWSMNGQSFTGLHMLCCKNVSEM